MARSLMVLFLFSGLLLGGCAEVYMTKTAKGFFPQTKPGNVDVLMMRPTRDYVELASIVTTNWHPDQIAKMHNALRAKAAPMGADAVVLLSTGITANGKYMWATGAAIQYGGKK
jgi:hypothetical protein